MNESRRPGRNPSFQLLQWLRPIAICGAGLLTTGCSEKAPETFYEPPKQSAPNAVASDWFEQGCLYGQELLNTAAVDGPEAVADSLQQLLLRFGFEEIRADPSFSSEDSQHVTASIRGLTRDTLVVLSEAPPNDAGNLLPLLSVARAWARNTNPDEPPLMTLRFAVLGSRATSQQGELDASSVVADFLSHRPRTVAQTAAVIALDPNSAATFTTNTTALQPVIDALASSESNFATDSGLTPIGEALELAQLPAMSANLGADLTQTCKPADIAAIQAASQQLLELIETSLRALGKPPTGEITLTDG